MMPSNTDAGLPDREDRSPSSSFPSAAVQTSDEAVELGIADRAEPDAAASPVVHVDDPVACSAFERVVPDKLQEGYDLLLVAFCAHAVNGIAVGMRGLQLANKRPLFRPFEGVAIRIGLKALDATLFLMQLQHRVLHRQLLRLKRDQAFEKFGDEAVGGLCVGVRLSEERSDVLGDLGRRFGHSGSVLTDTDEGSDGL